MLVEGPGSTKARPRHGRNLLSPSEPSFPSSPGQSWSALPLGTAWLMIHLVLRGWGQMGLGDKQLQARAAADMELTLSEGPACRI